MASKRNSKEIGYAFPKNAQWVIHKWRHSHRGVGGIIDIVHNSNTTLILNSIMTVEGGRKLSKIVCHLWMNSGDIPGEPVSLNSLWKLYYWEILCFFYRPSLQGNLQRPNSGRQTIQNEQIIYEVRGIMINSALRLMWSRLCYQPHIENFG